MPSLDTDQIDALLETLTGVVRARVRPSANGEGLTEIHVLSDGEIAPKQIVRNIETLLKTAFDLSIDHRIVSIAVLKEGADVDDIEREAPEAPGREARAETPAKAPRIVFRKVRVVQEEELKCTAYVELELDDVIFEGSHRDTDTPRARVFSSARAVIEALEYLAEKKMAFYLAGIEQRSMFQRDVLVALVEGRHLRERRRMLGTAFVQDDPQDAAVRAVLDAVNRFVTRPNGNDGHRS
ncbi:MAG: hypothetical protein R3199_11550 [Gemmatimonadota bacterium]|nr:hypothetical protein [Gemmatimonadota bacterium]